MSFIGDANSTGYAIASPSSAHFNGLRLVMPSRHRQEVFARSKGRCIYCAGQAPATTIDHMPPRSMFDRKDRPKGMEFPSCVACNNGAGKADLVAAFLGRIYTEAEGPGYEEEVDHLLTAINNNIPGFIGELSMPRARQKHLLQRLRVEAGGGLVLSGPIVASLMDSFAARLAFALHFEATGTMIPETGGVSVRVFTNIEIVDGLVPEGIFAVLPPPNTLRAGRKNVGSQFRYSSTVTDDGTMTMSFASFRLAFAVAAFSSLDRTKLVGPGGTVFAPGSLAVPPVPTFHSAFTMRM